MISIFTQNVMFSQNTLILPEAMLRRIISILVLSNIISIGYIYTEYTEVDLSTTQITELSAENQKVNEVSYSFYGIVVCTGYIIGILFRLIRNRKEQELKLSACTR
jgi:hypothetical protein